MNREQTLSAINAHVAGCNACYVHGSEFEPLQIIDNQVSKILVVTPYPEDWMTKSSQFIETKEYADLSVYFGDSWLTRPVSPLSHTFAIRCPRILFNGTRARPLQRCRMHTVDYIAGLKFKGIIGIGEEPKNQLSKTIGYGEMVKTKNERLVLILKYPNQSSIQEIQSAIDLIKIFKDKLSTM